MKKHLSTIFLFLIFFLGLSLLLYPTFSDWWNSMHQSRAISTYSEAVATMDNEKYDEIWSAAWEYNRSLIDRPNDYLLSEEQKVQYEALLDIGQNGIMGYIEIPKIDVTLPVYHGTEESVLQVAIGHLEWTSLPVGGESTHSVLSGHRGLPSAELLTNIDHLEVGDRFTLHILNMELTYRVDQIRVVEPNDASLLQIEQGQDYVTLLTCTPYGINSHRLLVRGARVYTDESAALSAPDVRNEAETVSPVYWLPPALVALGAAGGALYLAGSAAKKTWKNKHTADEHGEAYETR